MVYLFGEYFHTTKATEASIKEPYFRGNFFIRVVDRVALLFLSKCFWGGFSPIKY